MRPYDILLFDADNTLFDFTQCEQEALRKAMARLGIKLDSEQHHAYSQINQRCWRDYEDKKITKKILRLKRFQLFFEQFAIDADPVAFGSDYLSHLADTAFLFDGATALLETLNGTHRLVLVTNGLKEVQRSRLEAGGISSFFETIIVSDEIGYAKPHTPFFDHTFVQIGRPKKGRVLIIGDNINADIKGGLDYGIDACWFNPQNEARPQEIEPTYQIQHLKQLHPILEPI